MRRSELAEAMVVPVDRLMNALEGKSALDRAVESIVIAIGQFNGKDTTSYLETYKTEMMMRDILEDRDWPDSLGSLRRATILRCSKCKPTG